MLDELYMEQAEWTGEYVDRHVDEALEWSRQNHQVTVTQVSDDTLAAIRRKLSPMMDAYVRRVAEKGIDGRRLIEFLQRGDEGAEQ